MKTKQTNQQDESQEFKKEEDTKMIQGYHEKRIKQKIGNINDFISKMKKTNFLKQFLSYNDPKWAGLSILLNNFSTNL